MRHGTHGSAPATLGADSNTHTGSAKHAANVDVDVRRYGRHCITTTASPFSRLAAAALCTYLVARLPRRQYNLLEPHSSPLPHIPLADWHAPLGHSRPPRSARASMPSCAFYSQRRYHSLRASCVAQARTGCNNECCRYRLHGAGHWMTASSFAGLNIMTLVADPRSRRLRPGQPGLDIRLRACNARPSPSQSMHGRRRRRRRTMKGLLSTFRRH